MRPQSVRYAITSAAAILLVVVLALMVNWIGARRWGQYDWTRSRIYTLSTKSEGILIGLEQEIRVTVLMDPATPLYEQVHEILDRYEARSPEITVDYVDIFREPLKTSQIAQQFKIEVADTVVFTSGERSKYVTADEIVEYDYSEMQFTGVPKIKSFKGEEKFTAAILSLVTAEVPKVYFVTGHGEASSAGGGAVAERSLAKLNEKLEQENIATDDVALLSGAVPGDADVLAIIGPTEPFTEAEVELLAGYLAGGGRVLVALDPLIDPSGVMRHTRLEAFLAEHGVVVGDDLVVDPSRRLPFFDLSAVYLTDFRSHPVTTGLEGVAALFRVTRSVTPTGGEGVTARALVETTTEGWGETNLNQLLKGEPVSEDEDDTAGPVGVAAVVEPAAADASPMADDDTGEEDLVEAPAEVDGFRLLVFGDSDFLVDTDLDNAGNLTLALNAFDWLAAQEESLGIPPREVEQVSLYLSGDQLNLIYLVTLLVLPGLAIVAGILVWRARRH